MARNLLLLTTFFASLTAFGNAPSIPVRVDREFFMNPLQAEIQAKGQGQSMSGFSQKLESNVLWEELPPPAPEPTGPFIADFREHPGCTLFPDLSSDETRVCFNVVPDVSSLDMTAESIRPHRLVDLFLEGIRGQFPPECRPVVSDPKFISAAKSEKSVTLRFESQVTPPEDCPKGGELKIQLKFLSR